MPVEEQGAQQAEILQENKILASTTEKDVEGSTPSSTPPPSRLEPGVTAKRWIVTLFLSLGYGLCFWPVPTASSIGSLVSADFGQNSAYLWFVPAWTIATTVSFMINGANTDILGRRWFLVGGNLICTVGHLIAGASKQTANANLITVGMTLCGFGAGCCQMAAFALPELLPNKWRHLGIIGADASVYITILVAPITARFSYEWDQWVWNFYAPAIFQALAFLGLFFLYFPPAHPAGLPFLKALKEIDYLGILFYTIGCVPVLVGIVWAGIYKSSDPHVIASLVIGFFFLIAFGLWETYGSAKYPLAPPHIFASSWGRDFSAPALSLAITNMFYYSTSILISVMVNQLWTTGGAEWQYAIVLSLPQGLAICLGASLLFCFGGMIRHWQWQLAGSTFIVVLFGGLLGMVTPDNKGMMIAFLFISQTAFAWSVPLSIMLSQMGVEHRDLGISGGISGSLRFAGSAVASTVFQTILNNKVAEFTPKLVVPAAVKAGLDQAKAAELLAVISSPSLSTMFSPAVAEAASEALKQAYCKAIFVVTMSSLGFGVVAIVACLFSKDVDSKMTAKIDLYLENDVYADRNRLQ